MWCGVKRFWGAEGNFGREFGGIMGGFGRGIKGNWGIRASGLGLKGLAMGLKGSEVGLKGSEVGWGGLIMIRTDVVLSEGISWVFWGELQT